MPQIFERPDAKAVINVIREINSLYNTMTRIAGNDTAIKHAIAGEAEGLRQQAALSELSRIEVETLNADKQGIRVSALRSAGFKNIAQLYGLPVYRITNINGIGEQSALRIKQIVDRMFQAVVVSAKIQINVKQRSPGQDILVRNLYILRYGETARTQIQGLLARESNIIPALSDTKPASGFFKWVISSKTKKDTSVLAFQYLIGLLQGAFTHEAHMVISDYNTVISREINEVYSDFERNAVAYYTLLESLGLSTSKAPATGLPEELVSAVEQYQLNGEHMKTALRRYQIFGAKYILRQKKALLGDEMGLGKTIQALAVIGDMKSKGETHFLVVCPASVLVNWKRETDKHTDISSIIIHGWDKELEFEQWKQEGGVGITNYESLLRLADKIDFKFGVLVVDEAHFVKNPDAQRTKALLTTAKMTDRILYMTGTPLENRVEEMCFLVGCLRPDISKKLSTMKTLSATQKFKSELAAIYLRRVRDDVLTELPDLIENEDWLEPSKAELSAYFAAVRSGNFMAMRRVSWDVDLDGSNKANRLQELCDEARDEGRKIIVFSFFRDTLNKVYELLSDRALGPIKGGVSTAMRQQLIDEFTEAESGKVLIAQVQAGGVGLNIQSANVVIFCEPQIKPSLETQAISRAYRMGQIRDVHVHRLLCVNTIDERMMDMLRGKQAEFDTYADESVIGVESLREQPESAWIKQLIEQEKERMSTLQIAN